MRVRQLLLLLCLSALPPFMCVGQAGADTDKRQLATKLNTLLRGHVNASQMEATPFDQVSKVLPKADNADSPQYQKKMIVFRDVIREQIESYIRESNSLRVTYFESSFDKSEIENLVGFFESPLGQKYRKIEQESSRFVVRESEALTIKMYRDLEAKSKEIFGK